MDQLKVIGAVFVSFVIAGTIWWYSGRPQRTHPETSSGSGEKETTKRTGRPHAEVPASIKLRHERILRAKPKKRPEPPPKQDSSSEEDELYTMDRRNLRKTSILHEVRLDKCHYSANEQVIIKPEDREKAIRNLEPTAQLAPRIEANLNLMHLSQDFIYAATSYGKIIISEYYLPVKNKTIKPIELGGVLGGQKYIVHNILFKFAVDASGLFGGEFAAAKVAGNELRGLMGFFNCHINQLNLPLLALVDYRGFRLIAMSILPVGKDTIIYGSCDAGRNIHATDAELNKLMAKAAKMQNLKPHECRVAKKNFKPQTKVIFESNLNAPKRDESDPDPRNPRRVIDFASISDSPLKFSSRVKTHTRSRSDIGPYGDTSPYNDDEISVISELSSSFSLHDPFSMNPRRSSMPNSPSDPLADMESRNAISLSGYENDRELGKSMKNSRSGERRGGKRGKTGTEIGGNPRHVVSVSDSSASSLEITSSSSDAEEGWFLIETPTKLSESTPSRIKPRFSKISDTHLKKASSEGTQHKINRSRGSTDSSELSSRPIDPSISWPMVKRASRERSELNSKRTEILEGKHSVEINEPKRGSHEDPPKQSPNVHSHTQQLSPNGSVSISRPPTPNSPLSIANSAGSGNGNGTGNGNHVITPNKEIPAEFSEARYYSEALSGSRLNRSPTYLSSTHSHSPPNSYSGSPILYHSLPSTPTWHNTGAHSLSKSTPATNGDSVPEDSPFFSTPDSQNFSHTQPHTPVLGNSTQEAFFGNYQTSETKKEEQEPVASEYSEGNPGFGYDASLSGRLEESYENPPNTPRSLALSQNQNTTLSYPNHNISRSQTPVHTPIQTPIQTPLQTPTGAQLRSQSGIETRDHSQSHSQGQDYGFRSVEEKSLSFSDGNSETYETEEEEGGAKRDVTPIQGYENTATIGNIGFGKESPEAAISASQRRRMYESRAKHSDASEENSENSENSESEDDQDPGLTRSKKRLRRNKLGIPSGVKKRRAILAYQYGNYDGKSEKDLPAVDEDDLWDGTEIMYSPADLEGHKGYDGRFYLLDFSRVLPPERPNPLFKNSHLSRLLRPEFVKEYHKPLCSDAFSGFIKGTAGEEESNMEIEEATNYLLNVLIPKFAKEVQRLMVEAREQGRLNRFRLTETAHSAGVNCRHFGVLRKLIPEPEFKEIILLEITARCIKNSIRWKFREKMRQIALPMEEPYRRLVINHFNLIFGNTKTSDCEEELQPTFHLKLRKSNSEINTEFLYCLYSKVTQMLGMKFGFGPSRESNFLNPEPFDDTDLETIGEHVKHMNIISHAQGYFYHVKGLANRIEDPEVARNFYGIAIEKFSEALNSDPNNKEILLSMALTWTLMIEDSYKHIPNAKFERYDPKVKKAEEYSLRAIFAEPKYDSFSLFRYAQFLERCGRYDDAEDYYLMALEADPDNAGCLHCYGSLLSERGFEEDAENFFRRASQQTIGLSQWPQWYH